MELLTHPVPESESGSESDLSDLETEIHSDPEDDNGSDDDLVIPSVSSFRTIQDEIESPPDVPEDIAEQFWEPVDDGAMESIEDDPIGPAKESDDSLFIDQEFAASICNIMPSDFVFWLTIFFVEVMMVMEAQGTFPYALLFYCAVSIVMLLIITMWLALQRKYHVVNPDFDFGCQIIICVVLFFTVVVAVLVGLLRLTYGFYFEFVYNMCFGFGLVNYVVIRWFDKAE